MSHHGCCVHGKRMATNAVSMVSNAAVSMVGEVGCWCVPVSIVSNQCCVHGKHTGWMLSSTHGCCVHGKHTGWMLVDAVSMVSVSTTPVLDEAHGDRPAGNAASIAIRYTAW